MNKILSNVSTFFHFKDRSATFKKELLGGLSTFMAMAYILAVNPGMLTQADGGHKEYAGVFFLGTAIAAAIGSIAMGLFANVPVALAPGMGVNAFFTYTVASNILGLSLGQAFICTFASGLLYAIIAITPARNYIAKLLPRNLKLAIGAMIGLFLAYIGLCDSGIITTGAANYGVAGMVTVGTATKFGNIGDPFVIIAVVTLILVFILHYLKVKGAAVLAMIAAVIMVAIASAFHVRDASSAFKIGNYQDFGKFGHLSKEMWSSVGSTFKNGKAYIAIFVFLYIDFFDTTGTLFSVGEQAKLNKEADKWLAKANFVDAGATMFGSVMLTSTVSTYVESSVGVSQGARTGLSSVFVGILMALSIAIYPILTPFFPITHEIKGTGVSYQTVAPITGPILIMVGSLMLSQLKFFNWKQVIDIPVLFVTLVIGMLAYSISAGIASGIIVYYALNLFAYITSIVSKKPLEIEDTEISLSDNFEKIPNEVPDLKKRILNPVMITLVIIAIVYFATMPLYAF